MAYECDFAIWVYRDAGMSLAFQGVKDERARIMLERRKGPYEERFSKAGLPDLPSDSFYAVALSNNGRYLTLI